jgi:hypothetical protein
MAPKSGSLNCEKEDKIKINPNNMHKREKYDCCLG